MSQLTKEALADFVTKTQEMLDKAGFTGVELSPGSPSEEAVAALSEEGDDENPFGDPKFVEEIGYHRITTDQATFGIWFQPYVTVDIGGLGIDPKAFLPEGASADGMPEGWCLIGLDEGVFEKLFAEISKKSGQP
jgi:hypothetical protein